MSTWTCSKPASVAGKDYKGAFNLVCRWALDCWQSGQEPVQHATLRFMSGQTKRCAIKWLDALTTGWGKPCNLLKMCCRTADGTSGWGRPCEVSHKTVWLEFGIGTCSSCRVVLVKGSCCISLSSSWATARASRSTGNWDKAQTLLERASATCLVSPSIWRMPLVNSEM